MAIQDSNLNLMEEQYRDLNIPSYSVLSSIKQQGIDVLSGEKLSFNFKFGKLVDTMCFEPHKVKELFYRGSTVKPPTSSHKKIVDKILENIFSKDSSNEKPGIAGLKRKKSSVSNKLKDYKSKIVNYCIAEGVLKTYNDDKKYSTIVSSSSDYFKDKVDSMGKILIKDEMWKLAHQTAITLQTHRFTAKYFAKNVDGVEIFYQYQFDVKVNGRRVKGMLDCVIVNHHKKIIIPVDLKTGEAPVKGFPHLYVYHGYYIQGGLYREALRTIVENDFDLDGYVVNPFEFIYISKLNPYKPMIYVVDDELHDNALHGFTGVYGYFNEGVYQLIEDYYACVEDGYCEYTKTEENNKGRVIIKDVVK